MESTVKGHSRKYSAWDLKGHSRKYSAWDLKTIWKYNIRLLIPE